MVSGILTGGAAGTFGCPLVRAVWDPVQRETIKGGGGYVPVAPWSALPEDGSPVSVAVVIPEPVDGWNRMPPTTVGTVWLRRVGSDVDALSSICPHLGCGVDWESSSRRFFCPCHISYFRVGGEVESGPSPRGMDPLDCRVRNGEVEVRFQRFVLGTSERRPV